MPRTCPFPQGQTEGSQRSSATKAKIRRLVRSALAKKIQLPRITSILINIIRPNSILRKILEITQTSKTRLEESLRTKVDSLQSTLISILIGRTLMSLGLHRPNLVIMSLPSPILGCPNQSQMLELLVEGSFRDQPQREIFK